MVVVLNGGSDCGDDGDCDFGLDGSDCGSDSNGLVMVVAGSDSDYGCSDSSGCDG